jgi:hypothetical protein
MEQVTTFVTEYIPKGKKEYSEKSKSEYIKMFKVLSKKFNTEDFITLFTEDYSGVLNTLKKDYSSNTYWSKINTFCKFYDIPVTDIVVTSSKNVVKRDLEKIRENILGITDNIKAKVFLSLYTNKTGNAVRRDWATVMIKENCSEEDVKKSKSVYSYKTGTFEFRVLNKTQRTMSFEIEEPIQKLLKEYIETLGDYKYLYQYKASDESNDTARLDSFTQYLIRITTKYLGEKITTNDFRKALVNDDLQEIYNSGKSDTEKLKMISEAASKKDHSINTELSHYIQEASEHSANVSVKTECSNSYMSQVLESDFSAESKVAILTLLNKYKHSQDTNDAILQILVDLKKLNIPL